MSPLIFVLLGLVSVGALGVAFVPGILGASRAEKRKRAFKGDLRVNRQAAAETRAKDQRRKSVQDALKGQADNFARKKRVPLQMQIYQAGMKIKTGAYIRNSAILGVIVTVVCVLLQVPIIFAPVFGLAAAYLLPKWWLRRSRRRFQDKFLEELPNAVEAIVRGIKTGMPLNDSIRVVAREVKQPVRAEFARVLDQLAFGMSMAEAVQIIYERVPLSEVNFFVVVINVQQQSGGNLSEALNNLSSVLRARKKMKAKVKAMSAEAKASAMIIGALPPIVATLVTFASPNYLTPLYTTNTGYICLAVAALMMSVGVFIMNRMIQFDF